MAHGPSLFAGHFAGPITRVRGNPPAPIPPTRPWLIPPRTRTRTVDDGGGDDYGFGGGYSGPPVGTLGAFNPAVSFDEWAKDYTNFPSHGLSQQGLAERYAADMAPVSKPSLSLLDSWKSGGFGGVLSNLTSEPTDLIGHVLSPFPGGGMAIGAALRGIRDYTQGRIDRDYAKEQLGVKGYNAFTYDGAPFSISPGIFGGRAITAGGLVPDWLTVDMVEEYFGKGDFGEGGPKFTGPDWGDPEGNWGGAVSSATDQTAEEAAYSADDVPYNTGGLVTADRGRSGGPGGGGGYKHGGLVHEPPVRRGLGSLADAPWGDLARMDLSRLGRRW